MGYITEKIVTEEKIKIADCIECGSSNISLSDYGYSSFNIAYGKCNKCGNVVKFDCGCFVTKKEIAKLSKGFKK